MLDILEGKTIERIDQDRDDGFVVVHFSDKTMWMITSRRWNCAGTRLVHDIGYLKERPSNARQVADDCRQPASG